MERIERLIEYLGVKGMIEEAEGKPVPQARPLPLLNDESAVVLSLRRADAIQHAV